MKRNSPFSIFNFQFLAFVKKEFYHIWRDKRTMFILLGMPVVQIVIFGFALTNEVKNAKFAVLDQSKDAETNSLINQLDASRYFDLEKNLVTSNQIEEEFQKDKIKIAIIFPPHFGGDLRHFNKAQVQLIADAADPNLANQLTNYATAIIMDYQKRITDGQHFPLGHL